jgi:hypothetical protein
MKKMILNRLVVATLSLLVQSSLAVDIPLSFEPADALARDGKTVRLTAPFLQSGDGPLAMEAEDAQWCAWEGNVNAGRHNDRDCSGEFSVSHVEQMRFRFTLAKAGAYTVWIRASYPGNGGWNHEETMDGAKAKEGLTDGLVVDANIWRTAPISSNVWIWCKGVSYPLAAGQHDYELCFKSGALLDKVVLLPEGAPAPEGLGPDVAPRDTPLTVVTQSRPVIRPPDGAWGRIGGLLRPRGGRIRLEASQDGRAWNAVPDSGDLEFARAWTSLRLRVILSAVGLQQSPLWLNPYVEVVEPALTPRLELARTESLEAIPLFPQAMQGVSWDGAAFTLRPACFQFGSNGACYMEAEAAQGRRFDLHESAALARDPGASGGLYVRNRDLSTHQLRFDLAIPKKGAYTLWARLRDGKTGKFGKARGTVMWDVGELKAQATSTSNPDRPDKAKIASMTFSVPVKEPAPGATNALATTPQKPAPLPEGWVWARGATQTLLPGVHALYLHGGFDYTDVDRLAVLPESMEPDPAAANAPQSPVAEGAVTFAPLPSRPDLTPVKVEPAGAWRVSTDQGASFSPLPADGLLAALPGATNGLVLQAVLQRDGRAAMPNPRVLLAEPLKAVRLQSDRLEAWFDTVTGSPLALFSRTENRWLTPFGLDTDPFDLAYEVPGEGAFRTLSFADARLVSLVSPDTRHLTATYQLLAGGLTITTAYDYSGADGVDHWTIGVDNRSTFTVREVGFPHASFIRAAADPMQETLGWPGYLGQAFAYPAGGFAMPQSLYYPGTASLGYFSLGGPSNTLYVAARHTDGILVKMTLDIPAPNESCGFAFRKEIAVPPAQAWTGDYALSSVPGDWHAAADLHRRWLDTWLPRRQTAAWVADCDGFFHNRVDLFTRLPVEGAMINDWYDMHYNQIWGWTADGEYVGFYPVPDPRLGSQKEAARHIRKFTAQGNHRGYYLNAQGYVRDYQTLDPIGWSLPRALLPAKYTKQVGGSAFFDRVVTRTISGDRRLQGVWMGTMDGAYEMCTGAAEWQDNLARWTTTIWMKDFGVNALYLDQTGCVIQRCFSPNHGHGVQHAACGRGFAETARKIREKGQAINPDFVFGIEGMTDLLSSYADYGVWVGNLAGRGNYLTYCLPDIRVARGIANGNWSYYTSRREAYRDIALCNWFDYMDNEGLPTLRVRQSVRPFVGHGRFMDTVGLSIENGWVKGAWYLRTNGQWKTAAVLLHNPDESAAASFSLAAPLAGRVMAAFSFGEGRLPRKHAFTQDGGVLRTTVPVEPFSAVVFVSETPAAESLLIEARQSQAPGEDHVEGVILNLSGKPQQAAVSLALPARMSAVPAALSLDIPAGDAAPIRFALPGVASLPWWEKATVTASTGSVSVTETVLLTPPLVNGGMERDTNKDNHPDGWLAFDIQMSFLHFQNHLDLQTVDGESDPWQPAKGKTSLLLREPMPYLQMNPKGPRLPNVPADKPWQRYCSTPLVLKASTPYALKGQVKAESDGKVLSVSSGNLVALSAQAKAGQWTPFETRFTTPSNHVGLCMLTLRNISTNKVWVDGVSVTEETR